MGWPCQEFFDELNPKYETETFNSQELSKQIRILDHETKVLSQPIIQTQ